MDDMYLFKSQDEGDRLLYAYYKGEFWFYDPNVQQWYISGHVREQYELEAQKDVSLTPDDFTCTGYGYEFVAEYEVPVSVLDALRAAKKVLPPEPASTEVPLPRPGDVYRSPKSGQLYKIGELTNGKKTCYLTMRSNAQGGTWVPVNSSVYPKLSDAQGEFEAWIRTEHLEPVAPTGAAAATTDGSAVTPMAAETSTTSESGEDASNSPGSTSAPADTSPQATKTVNNAPATPTTAMAASGNGLLPAFDFGADADTNAGLINDAQIFMAGSMARVMAAKRAHDRTANRYRGSWGKWCDFVGISRDTGDNMVRVAEQFGNIQVDGKPLIDLQPLKLLYATSKPSTPPEIRQQVENLDITSYKQYQEALAEIRARDEKITELLEMSEAADRRADKAEQAAKDTARERDTALRRAAEAEKQRDGARDALQAAKLRGDKLKAENDALKAHPIEAQVVDEEEINRRAQARADELTAPLREELETLRNRHPADLEEAEQAIRDAYDSAIYTSRTIENAWHSLRPLLSCMDSERRVMAVRQLEKILTKTQEELRKCL